MWAEPNDDVIPHLDCPLCGSRERRFIVGTWEDPIGVARCTACGLVHTTGRHATQAVSSSRAIDGATRRLHRHAFALYDRLLRGRLRTPAPGATALDIGCDSGTSCDCGAMAPKERATSQALSPRPIASTRWTAPMVALTWVADTTSSPSSINSTSSNVPPPPCTSQPDTSGPEVFSSFRSPTGTTGVHAPCYPRGSSWAARSRSTTETRCGTRCSRLGSAHSRSGAHPASSTESSPPRARTKIGESPQASCNARFHSPSGPCVTRAKRRIKVPSS
jgi:hypothetical protein